MLSATSRALRIAACRVPPPAASTAVSPMPEASPSRSTQIAARARSLSSTGRVSYAINTNPNPPLGKKNASNEMPSRIGLIGARGYTGQALVELLDKHPNMDLCHVSSRELDGQELKDYTKRKIIYKNLSPEEVAQLDKEGQVDCWVMALPNGVCQPFVRALGQSSSLIIDLSADHRFDGTWGSYGLPELVQRSKIAQSTRISCPGCYSTGSQLALAPVLEHLGGMPTVFGVSGYSGAGTKPSPKNDVHLLRDNLMPYSLTGHIHEQEISHHLDVPTAFIPHCASWFRGIHLTINIPLNKTMTSRDVRQIYQDRYAGEKLVKVVGEAPLVKSIQNRHGVEIGAFAVDDTGKRVVVCATIDNLNKGAATQCLQNMNLALGYDEYQGIPID
ncbi:N-acetyl-gamma-glutamyl-phosphate reductase, type 1 [Metarhizium album ARSEF 1941]|uniref:N-acetyl-gamma-glutamyl-phosphate reductase, type 1 n=1 Tax=Metarhizium album (strain ARSEF 1941) TaxID=1081103 RepID=A0A0B2WYZ1_METAS|nr:N-acetyl-gamma-glutamyl-phosphate reductase, type 1 [Metarhizium album ARSEF 1941]KHN98657.1 N-acetyl-gamma-glutamyl-phosphate reductase, type 1 [Metarhizium album ARSEF 1941]